MTDGRSRQKPLAWDLRWVIDAWLESQEDDAAINLAVLHEHLVCEHGYRGSLRSVQR